MVAPTCGNCLFWHSINLQTRGLCRRYPPMVSAGHPTVVETAWCGEHKPRFVLATETTTKTETSHPPLVAGPNVAAPIVPTTAPPPVTIPMPRAQAGLMRATNAALRPTGMCEYVEDQKPPADAVPWSKEQSTPPPIESREKKPYPNVDFKILGTDAAKTAAELEAVEKPIPPPVPESVSFDHLIEPSPNRKRRR